VVGRNGQAGHISLNGQLPVPSIHQNGKSDPRGTPKVANRVESGPDGSAREEDIIHEDDISSIDVEGNLGAMKYRPALHMVEIIPVKGDINGADRRDRSPEFPDFRGKAFGERHSSGSQPDEMQRSIISAAMPQGTCHVDD
jgi:hypothetical protein